MTFFRAATDGVERPTITRVMPHIEADQSVVLGAGEVKSISVYTKREIVAPLAFH